MANYDPAKEACSPNYVEYRQYLQQHQASPVGPGGSSIVTENNEKGILDTDVLQIANGVQYAALGSDHDSYRQGIYSTNSVGDRD